MMPERICTELRVDTARFTSPSFSPSASRADAPATGSPADEADEQLSVV